MASYMSDAALNVAADATTDSGVGIRLHTGAPGNAGTGNRVGTVTVTLAAALWTTASGGVSERNADIDFGVLSTTAAITVTAYSLYRISPSGTFIGWADLSTGVAVAANESFKLDSGTVEVRFARP